jgi:hypothetical protein
MDDDEKRAFEAWDDRTIWDMDADADDLVWKVFMGIRWRFTEQGRKHYSDLPILEHVEH